MVIYYEQLLFLWEDEMSPKLPKEYSDFRKKQILMAACECFGEKGYSETTMREIARRMNVSTGVLYNYFKGKDEILEAINVWSRDNNQKIIDQIRQKASGREAMIEFFRNSLECCPIDELKKNARGNISLLSEALKRENIRNIYNSHFEHMLKNISQFVKEGIERKEIQARLDPKAVAGFYNALLIGLQVQLVLIDDLCTESYIENIKKIAFENIWHDA
jgi:AcrR family transcriptional regulator